MRNKTFGSGRHNNLHPLIQRHDRVRPGRGYEGDGCGYYQALHRGDDPVVWLLQPAQVWERKVKVCRDHIKDRTRSPQRWKE